MAFTWFDEIGCCCCLPPLPQFACSILATTGKPSASTQYIIFHVSKLHGSAFVRPCICRLCPLLCGRNWLALCAPILGVEGMERLMVPPGRMLLSARSSMSRLAADRPPIVIERSEPRIEPPAKVRLSDLASHPFPELHQIMWLIPYHSTNF